MQHVDRGEGLAAKVFAAVLLAGSCGFSGVSLGACTSRDASPTQATAQAAPAPDDAAHTVAELVALKDGGAVMIRARDQRWELARVDGGGREMWARVLREGEAAPLNAVMAVEPDGREGFVRYTSHASMFVRAFDADGNSRWEMPVCKPVEGDDTAGRGAGSIHAASTHVVVDCAQDDRKIIALDRETGRIRATHSATGIRAAGFGGGYYDLALGRRHGADAAWVFPAGGSWAGDGCIADDLVIGTRRHDENKHLFAFDGTQYRFEVPFGHRYVVQVRGCARYRDKLVVNTPNKRWESVIGIVNMSGEIEREFATDDPLDPGIRSEVGPTPRFVPLLVKAQVSADAERVSALTMIDLERGEVAWTVVTGENFYDQKLFRVGDTWYWVVDENGNARIVAFAGATGELAGAIEVKDRVLPPSATSIGGGALWLAGREPRIGAPRLATLDAATLRVVRADGLDVVDVRARVAAVLATREPGCYDCRPGPPRARGRRPL